MTHINHLTEDEMGVKRPQFYGVEMGPLGLLPLFGTT